MLHVATADLPPDRTTRTHVAPGSDAVEAQQRFLASAAHEPRGEVALQLALVGPRSPTGTQTRPPYATRAAASPPHANVGNGCLRRCSPSPGASAGRLRREPVDLAATAADVVRADDHHGSGARRCSSRREQPAIRGRSSASWRTWSRRPSAATSARPALCRHVHRRWTRQLLDREHRTRDPGP